MKAIATSILCGFFAIMSPAMADDKAPTKDIVDTAVAAGSFKTLAAALGAVPLEHLQAQLRGRLHRRLGVEGARWLVVDRWLV